METEAAEPSVHLLFGCPSQDAHNGSEGVVQAVPWRFTVEDYHSMVEVGILEEDDRVELIEGEIVEMSPICSRHAGCVNFLNAFLTDRLRDTCTIHVQSPVRADRYGEPRPDLAILRYQADWFRRQLPGPSDVLTVVEVSDTSLRYDRQVKLPLYANEGMPEAWIVDLQSEVVERHSEPGKSGYRLTVTGSRGETLESAAVPGLVLDVDDVLG